MRTGSTPRKSLQAKRLLPCLLAASFALLLGSAFNVALAEDSATVSANLSKLEDKYFQHDFSKDEVGERIERLEKLVYGEARTGSDDERLKTLMSLVPNLDAKPDDSAAKSDNSTAATPTPAPDVRRGPSKAMRPATPLPDSNENEPIQNDNSYPAVTAMEKKLLGRDYVGESVGKRLDRLEIKAYGKTSASDDLQDRVDRLKSSTGIDVARAKPANSEWADEDEDPQSAGGQGVTPFTGISQDDPASQRNYRKQQTGYNRPHPSYDPYSGTGTFGAGGGSSGGGGSGSFGMGAGLGSDRGGSLGGLPPAAPDYSRPAGGPSNPIPAPAMGVSQQIALLEREVFKKSYDKETILNRLSRLESTVFPQDKPSSDKSLPERMSRLIAAVPISQAAVSPDPSGQGRKHRSGDPDFPDLDFGQPQLSSQNGQPQAKGPGGLSKIINGLGSALSGGYTNGYPAVAPGHLVTDPSTGLLFDQYTGTLIDPMTGAVVGRRQTSGYGYPGFNSGMSPYGGMGGMGSSMGGMSMPGMGGGMGFGFGGSGVRMGGWP